MQTKLISIFIIYSTISNAATEYAYSGTYGPLNWRHLYHSCNANVTQSPININYTPGSAESSVLTLHQRSPFDPVNWDTINATLKAKKENSFNIDLTSSLAAGMSSKYMDMVYDVVGFHFHTPSEHHLGGRHFPLDTHVVHKGNDSSLMVVGVFFEIDNENDGGDADPFFQAIVDGLKSANGTLTATGVPISLPFSYLTANMLGEISTYTGTLTSPDCDGPVKWIHFHRAIKITYDHYAVIKGYLEWNSRPTQPLSISQITSEDEWSYEGNTGLQTWPGLCASGKQQSPINLSEDKSNKESKYVKVREAIIVPRTWATTNVSMQLLHNAITLNLKPNTTFTTIDSKDFYLANIHLHTPSEHRIEGNYYPAEMHLVHKNCAGETKVIGIFIDANPKGYSAFLHQILSTASAIKNEESNHEAPKDLQISLDLLFGDEMYSMQSSPVFTYQGSLTTPPCTEGVGWYVLKHPIVASLGQWLEMVDIMGYNARPTMGRSSNRF